MNNNKLNEMIYENFPGYYITLISIIQGTAFGAFLLVLKDNFFGNTANLPDNLSLIIFFISTFLVLIEIWYEYMIGSLSMRWVPKILDSAIPFLLGLFEVLMIYCLNIETIINIPGWYFSLGIVCICSLFAFMNMFRGCEKSSNQNLSIIMDSIRNDSLKPQISILILGIIFILIGFFYDFYNLNQIYSSFFTLILIIIFVWTRHRYWIKLLKKFETS